MIATLFVIAVFIAYLIIDYLYVNKVLSESQSRIMNKINKVIETAEDQVKKFPEKIEQNEYILNRIQKLRSSAQKLYSTDFKKGIIKAGNYADLVLFNPATVKDNATIQDSKALSSGIEMVWINGQLTYQNKKATGNFPGVLIKRK